MFNDIQLIGLADLKLKYSARAQNYAAQNIANADTPGYSAVRINSFQEFLSHVSPQDSSGRAHTDAIINNNFAPDHYSEPNQNNVSLEEAMIEANSYKAGHAQAVAISKSAFDILRLSLGR